MARYVVIPNATCLKETDKAILVETPDHSEEFWVPKSQVSEESDVQTEEDEGDLIVTKWWATQNSIDWSDER